MAAQKPRIQLVLDFDGTITTENTTAIIGARCLAKAKELASADQSYTSPQPMTYYSDQYFKDYNKWQKFCEGSPEERKTIEDEVTYLSQSRQVEVDSFLRVRSAVFSILGGIKEFEIDERSRNEFMMEAGRDAIRHGEVRIRSPEALKLLIAQASKEGNNWGIVSVGWSRRFIVGVLLEAGLLVEYSEDQVASKIIANELLAPLSKGGRSEDGMIFSATDKKDLFHSLLAIWNVGERANNATANEGPLIIIYAGDSSTDIGCMAHASVGLYVCEDPTSDSVVQRLRRVAINCVPFNQLQISGVALPRQGSTESRSTVYLIKDFDEVADWLSSLG